MKEKKEKLKYFLINSKERYKSTNNRISSLYKDYYKLINIFEDKINNQKVRGVLQPKNNVNLLKKFIENQQIIIKELVNIINNLLSDYKTNTYRVSSDKKNTIKAIIRSNNINFNYLKNNTKINDENNSFYINLASNNNTRNSHVNNEKNKSRNKFNLDLSFLNINVPSKKRKKINQYININKQEEKYSNKYNNKDDISKSSISSNFISSKNKSYININHSFISNNDINKSNNNLNTSLIDGISCYNHKIKKINKINLKQNNSFKKYHSDKIILFNNASPFFTNINDKNKIKNNSLMKLLDNKNNYLIKIKNNKTPFETANYTTNRMHIPFSTFNNSSSEDIYINKEKYKNVCDIIKDKKINNLKKYEIVHQYQITPNRMTKEMYNISFSILNKFEQKRNKNISYRKKSKSLKNINNI